MMVSIVRLGGRYDLAHDPRLVVVGVANRGTDSSVQRQLDAKLWQHGVQAGFEVQRTTGDELAQVGTLYGIGLRLPTLLDAQAQLAAIRSRDGDVELQHLKLRNGPDDGDELGVIGL